MSDLRTPLFDWHVSHGARMVPFAGWSMPVQYAGVIPEHKAVRGGVGLFDISHMGRLSIHGDGALSLLETTTTNAIGTMSVGQVRYSLVCNERGGLLDDVLVTRHADHFGVCVNASNRAKIVAWFRQHAGNATVLDHTTDTTMIAVQGPHAVAKVGELFPPSVTALKNYYGRVVPYRGLPCVIGRTGYTGEDGFELVVPNDNAVSLWDDLIRLGAVPCGLGARDTLRLEAAMPLYGHELNESLDPVQAGLGWAVKLDKGDFIGRDAIRAADPARPIRIGLELDGKRAAREGSTILQGTTPIGTVTSGSYVPGLEKSIAMGYVTPQFRTLGTALAIDVRGTSIPATVVPLPFYRRSR